MSKCPACNDKGYVTIQDIIAGLNVEYDAPCPACTDIIEKLEAVLDEVAGKTKTAIIPNGKSVEDEITNTKIGEFLK